MTPEEEVAKKFIQFAPGILPFKVRKVFAYKACELFIEMGKEEIDWMANKGRILYANGFYEDVLKAINKMRRPKEEN